MNLKSEHIIKTMNSRTGGDLMKRIKSRERRMMKNYRSDQENKEQRGKREEELENWRRLGKDSEEQRGRRVHKERMREAWRRNGPLAAIC
jgi:hypothetical protein